MKIIIRKIDKKKEQGQSPALKIVSTLFSSKKLDLSFVRRGDAACARQGLLPRLGPPDDATISRTVLTRFCS
jgi:hypothetical protein